MVALGRLLALGPDLLWHLSHREALPLTGRYRGFLAPLVLIAAGLLILLVNLEYIQSDSLLRLFDLWPLILILVGIELVANRTLPLRAAAATAAAATALAVIGAVVYVALAPPLPASGQGRRDYSGPIRGISQATLEVDLGAINLDLQGAPLGDDVYQAHFEFPAGQMPWALVELPPGQPPGQPPPARLEPSTGTVRIGESRSGFNWFGVGGRRRATIKINDSIPWAIRLHTGASRQTADLATVQVSRIEVDGGASHVELTLGRPSGTVPITVNGGATNVVIHRPAGTAARVRVSGGASTLDADGTRYVGQDDLAWESGYGAGSDRYDIRVDGGASNVSVDTR